MARAPLRNCRAARVRIAGREDAARWLSAPLGPRVARPLSAFSSRSF